MSGEILRCEVWMWKFTFKKHCWRYYYYYYY